MDRTYHTSCCPTVLLLLRGHKNESGKRRKEKRKVGNSNESQQALLTRSSRSCLLNAHSCCSPAPAFLRLSPSAAHLSSRLGSSRPSRTSWEASLLCCEQHLQITFRRGSLVAILRDTGRSGDLLTCPPEWALEGLPEPQPDPGLLEAKPI